MQRDRDVTFIRKGGRVIPIRRKRGGRSKPAGGPELVQAGTAVATGSVLGVGAIAKKKGRLGFGIAAATLLGVGIQRAASGYKKFKKQRSR